MIVTRRTKLRLRRRLTGSLFCVLLLAGCLASPSAQAEVPNHSFLGIFVSGAPRLPLSALDPGDPGIEGSCGVAVDFEGKIYMSDFYHNAIGVYLPGGLVEKRVAVAPNGNGPCAIATDAFGSVYVNYYHGAVATLSGQIVDKGPATGVATDPETGDVYVSHRTSIAVYDAPVIPGEAPAFEIDPGAGGQLEDGYGLAVSDNTLTKGNVYVADAGNNTVKVYNPATSLTTPVQVIDGAGTSLGRFVSLFDSSLAIEQSSGNLFVVDNTQPGFVHPAAVISEFNPEGIFRDQLQHSVVHGEPVGITVNEAAFAPGGEKAGEIYVTSGNGSSIVSPPGPHLIPLAEQTNLYNFGLAGPGQPLTVAKTGAGQGTISSDSPGISCGTACKAEFSEGKLVVLTAAPAAGSEFAGWSGACSGAGSCQLTLGAATSVGAEFVPAPTILRRDAGATDAQIAPADAGTAAAAAATLRVRVPSSANGVVALRATTSGPGTLTATGHGLRHARASTAGAETVVFHLRLNRLGKHALASSKRGLLSLRTVLSFEPSQGGPGSVVGKIVTFKQARSEVSK